MQGILDGRGRQTLSQLVFWVFVPCLVFTKLAGSVNLEDLGVWCVRAIYLKINKTSCEEGGS